MRKKFKIVFLLCFAAGLFSLCLDSNAQSNEPSPSTEQVWTDEDWQKAIDGVEYIPQTKKEEKEKENNDFEIPETSARWDGAWLTSPTTKAIVIILTIALLIFTLVKLLGNTGNANVKVLNDNISIQELTEENFIETDLEKLLRYILSQPVKPYTISIQANQLYLSYRIRWTDINSSLQNEIKQYLSQLIVKANELDDFFVTEFACTKTNYAKEV